MTTKHILQSCSTCNDVRKRTWPTPTTAGTTIREKLFGPLLDLQTTAVFM
jgi:hypothetical protein